MKILKNDNIFVTKGKDKGKTGKVERVLIKQKKLVITGINKFKKHLKPTKNNPQGGISDVNMPIAIANVSIICPNCNKSTRVGYQIIKSKKTRICKKCNQAIVL
jgi:large subunit ribosomal protein L24